MAGGWSTQPRVDDLDDIDSWMAQRNADVGLREQGWSGRRLELERYSPVGRIWHGAPLPLKAAVGGAAAAGLGTYDYLNEGVPQ
jgi:hypothetical protein